jgi:hypothetical protein
MNRKTLAILAALFSFCAQARASPKLPKQNYVGRPQRLRRTGKTSRTTSPKGAARLGVDTTGHEG